MANINDTLDLVTQRTGSTSGTPQNEAEAAGFRTGIKLDISSVMNQMNSVYYPLFSTLSSTDAANALTLGLAGNVIFTHIGATAADASAYWDSGLARTRTIKETVDVLLTQISDLENQISFTVDVAAYDDSTLTGLINNNTLNLKQLRLDSMGENYGFDNDGLKDLTYPLSQAIDAMGAFFTGYPGSGNTYPGSPVYPTLTLAVLLSQVTLDTTIPISTITGLATGLSNIVTYTGMTDSTDTSPTYSTHGAIATVSDGQSLEVAIQALDAGIAASSGAYSTAANVTSNTAGDYTADDFVHGSPSLDDDTIVGHDSRFLFDKSSGAFRAGTTTGTEWNSGSRGANSVAFGKDNTASGGTSAVLGGSNNIASGAGSIVLGGTSSTTAAVSSMVAGIGNTIDVGSTYAVVLGGLSHTIATSTHALIGIGSTHAITGSSQAIIVGGQNHTVSSSSSTFIGGGSSNTIGSVSASNSAVIVGGGNNDIGTVGAGTSSFIGGGASNVIASAQEAFVGGGNTNTIANASLRSVIVGGFANAIGSNAAAGYSIIVGGDTNKVDRSARSVLVGGQSNAIGFITAAADHSVIVGGYSNDIDNGALNVIVGGGSSNSTLGNLIDTATSSFIGGGADNEIDVTVGSYHVIVGGYSNEIGDGTDTLHYSAIVGGYGNTITNSDYAFVGGGGSSTGGSENTIVGSDSAVIAGGFANDITSTSTYSFIGSGDTNTITAATHAVIAGGDTNSVTSNYATVVGGGNNVADSTYGTAMGQEASTDNHGVVAHSAGQFAAVGDAQFMRPLWRIQTTNATANVEAFLDGASARFAIDDDSTYAFFIRGVARRTDVNGESAHYTLEGTVDRNAGVTALVSTVTKVVVDEDTAAWDVQVLANDTNDALQIDVTGEAAKTINWVFSGEFVKVSG